MLFYERFFYFVSGFVIMESDPKFVVMKTEDLKEISEKLGDGYSCVLKDGVVLVDKDPFHGVEFVKHRFIGAIFKIGSVIAESLENFEPSTEEAYVDQLKGIARERYGEIKDGDMFDIGPLFYGIESQLLERRIVLDETGKYSYHSEDDVLSLHGFFLYKQGKWAKKVDKARVVSFLYNDSDKLSFIVEVDGVDPDSHRVTGFSGNLKSHIEKYFNE